MGDCSNSKLEWTIRSNLYFGHFKTKLIMSMFLIFPLICSVINRTIFGHLVSLVDIRTVNLMDTYLILYFSCVSPSDPNVTLLRWNSTDGHQTAGEASTHSWGFHATTCVAMEV